MTAATEPATAASPCTKVCRIDARSGLCEGCLRTLDEIGAWGAMSDAARRLVMQQLPERRDGPAPAQQST